MIGSVQTLETAHRSVRLTPDEADVLASLAERLSAAEGIPVELDDVLNAAAEAAVAAEHRAVDVTLETCELALVFALVRRLERRGAAVVFVGPNGHAGIVLC